MTQFNQMTQLEKTQNKLPSLEDLFADKEEAAQQNALLVILNATPPDKWLEGHPTAKVKDAAGNEVAARYLPIGRIEYLLTKIFLRWRVEILDTKLIANSVAVTVRLHVMNPISQEWDWQDGIGAVPLQTDKGAGAIEFDKVKSAAVQMAAPAAESYAIKDAAEKFGRIFGKDVNRRFVAEYETLATRFINE